MKVWAEPCGRMRERAGTRRVPLALERRFAVQQLAVPAFGAVVARFPRRRFVPLVYRFFIVNLLIFFALLHFDLGRIHVARAFFIWVSLFNLFTSLLHILGFAFGED